MTPASMSAKSSAARIDAIQVLRAVAAGLVVLGHSQTLVGSFAAHQHVAFTRSTLAPWGAGVDLFFVISGFIIVYASQDLFGTAGGAVAFLRRRVARVAPFYWLCTLLYLAVIVAAWLHGASESFTLNAIIASLLFWPYASFGPHGGVFPILDLGWTLNYEMFFYALFALAIGLRRVWAVAAVVAVMAALTAWGLAAPPHSDALRFWTRPVVLDFALGAGVAQLRCAGLRGSAPVRVALTGLGAALFLVDPLKLFDGAPGVTVANGLPRVLDAGLPAALMLAGAAWGPAFNWGGMAPLTKVGDASYSLYLTHPFVLILAGKLMTKSGVLGRIGPWPMVAMILVSCVVLALICRRWVETPLTRLTLRLTRLRPTRKSLPTAPPLQPEGV